MRYGGPWGSLSGWGSILLFLFGRVPNLFDRSRSLRQPPRLRRGGERDRGLLRSNRFGTRQNRNNRLDPQPNRLPQGAPYRKLPSPGNKLLSKVSSVGWRKIACNPMAPGPVPGTPGPGPGSLAPVPCFTGPGPGSPGPVPEPLGYMLSCASQPHDRPGPTTGK